MKNLFKSVSASGNPARFVWKDIMKPRIDENEVIISNKNTPLKNNGNNKDILSEAKETKEKKETQTKLEYLGFYEGEIDGIYGKAMGKAVINMKTLWNETCEEGDRVNVNDILTPMTMVILEGMYQEMKVFSHSDVMPWGISESLNFTKKDILDNLNSEKKRCFESKRRYESKLRKKEYKNENNKEWIEGQVDRLTNRLQEIELEKQSPQLLQEKQNKRQKYISDIDSPAFQNLYEKGDFKYLTIPFVKSHINGQINKGLKSREKRRVYQAEEGLMKAYTGERKYEISPIRFLETYYGTTETEAKELIKNFEKKHKIKLEARPY